MDFNFVAVCTSCNRECLCNIDTVVVGSEKRNINLCKECYSEIEEIQEWASSLNLNKKEYSNGKL